MRRRTALLVAAATSSALVACQVILGIEEHPLRPTTDAAPADATDMTSEPTDADAGTPIRWCVSEAIDADFCDDFDDPGQAPGAHWPPSDGVFVTGDASLAIETTYSSSPPQSLTGTSAGSFGGGTVATLEQTLHFDGGAADAAPPRGLRLEFDLKTTTLVLDASASAAFVGGFGRIHAPIISALGLVVDPNGLAIYQTASIFDVGDSSTVQRATVLDVPLEQLTQAVQFQRAILVVGPHDLIEAESLTCNSETVADAGDGGLLLAAKWFGTSTACLPLGGAFAGTAWLGAPLILVGAAAIGTSTVVAHIDNVVFRFVR